MTRAGVDSFSAKSGGRMGWRRIICDCMPAAVLDLTHLMLICCILGVLLSIPASTARAEGASGKSVFDTVIIRNRTPENTKTPDAGPKNQQKDNSAGAASEPGDQPGPVPASKEGSSDQNKDPSSARDAKGAGGGTSGDAKGHGGGAGHSSRGHEKSHAATVVREAGVSAEGGKTSFHLTLSAGVRVEIFTLANPYRVIIDLPDVEFALHDGTGHKGGGLVSAFRYGLFADKKGRIVIDATGPVRIEGAKMMHIARSGAVTLEMQLVSISEAEFGAGTGAVSSAAAAAAQPAPRPAIFDDPLVSPSEDKKPRVLIDPGHGGIDPGAVGINNLLEKTVVLDVAKRIERRLTATGRYRVALTRDRDVFLSLDQRVEMSTELGVDLFVSLHADSLESRTVATHVRGATIYTLSERASDEQARLMAEKENSSDQAAGIDSGAFKVDSEEVRSILFDLMKRETSNFSTDFSNLLVSRLKQSVTVSREPQRSAAFRVLKQTKAPSVLVELGYLSNDVDAKLMRQSEWQGKVAQSIVAAIDAFFDKRTARTGR